MNRAKQLAVATLVAVMLTTTASGCGRMMPFMARMIVAGAITAVVLSHHDAHYHDHHCGHRRGYIDQQEVYHYQDRWEYYDPETETWYSYDDYE